MTWYANEILGIASPGLLAEVVSFPPYRDATFVVRDIARDSEARSNRELSAPGLLIVRPVGEPLDLGSWYDEDVIPWLPPPSWPLENILCTAHDASAAIPDLDIDDLPPDVFLSALKALARRHRTAIAYAYFSTWGGSNQLEYAWVFSEDEERALFNTTQEIQYLEINDAGHTERKNGDMLESICNTFGFKTDGGYFYPHTRSFDWDKYKWRQPTDT